MDTEELPPYLMESLVIPNVSIETKNNYLRLALGSTILRKDEKINRLLTLKSLSKRDVNKQIAEFNREESAIKKKLWKLVNGSDYKAAINAYRKLHDQKQKVKQEIADISYILKVMTRLVHLIPDNINKTTNINVKSKSIGFKIHLVR